MILPGVGAAADAMARLRVGGLDALIPSLTQPVLGICLGMQLLHEASAEGGTRCLGIIPGAASRFAEAPGRPVPHMGWNTLEVERSCPLLEGLGDADYAYFVHSYAIPVNEATVASCRYGARFSACVAWRNFFGAQFHPERSARGRRASLEKFSGDRRGRGDPGGAVRLIPAIDLRAGRCVRLFKGDFAAETRYDAEPRSCSPDTAESARIGSMSSTWMARGTAAAATARSSRSWRRSAASSCKWAADCAMQRRFSRCWTWARRGQWWAVPRLTEPDEVRNWLRHFGGERIGLAFDVRLDDGGTPALATHGWLRQSTLSLWRAVEDFIDAGLEHVLCTDVGRDGALTGPNVDLYTEAVRRYPQLAWQASGGVRDARDLHALADCGAAAAISGKALLEGRIPIEELGPFLPNA